MLNDDRAAKMVADASNILMQIGLPTKQQNERSALTLLALLDLKPDGSWAKLGRPLLGITPMMSFFAVHYGKKYAPNSRETVRRFTVHQFLQAAIAVENPDRPERPTNSGKTVYQIAEEMVPLFQSYGTAEWSNRLKEYMSNRQSLKKKYARRRRMRKIPLRLDSGLVVSLSAGSHNALVVKIFREFASRFVPGGIPLYIGDTAEKFAYVDSDGLQKLGIILEAHGKIPDLVLFDERRNWVFLIEAVTSHGPIDAKRRMELRKIFARSKAGLVYVTAFDTVGMMKRYIADISWETEVWIADSPDHMIHFDGERFLGPDESTA